MAGSSKSETRNPKQIQIPKAPMFETNFVITITFEALFRAV
jgi:hypothetical protein